MKRDRPAKRDRRNGDFACDGERIEQCGDIVGHRIEGEFAARFLRQPGAARVVAQDTARAGKPRHDVVPAFERTAHFMDEHQSAFALAA